MRAIAVLFVALLGCDDRTTAIPPIQADHVVDILLGDPVVDRVDILYVMDRSPAFVPYRDTLARQFAIAGDVLSSLPGYVDLHLGVITADLGANTEAPAPPLPGECAGWGDGGVLLRSPLVDGAFITLRQTPAARHTNVRGSFASALPALADVGAVGCDRAQPLEAMRIALDGNPHDAGFVRPNASLFVIFVAAQTDTSPRSPAEYAAFLHGLKADPNRVFVIVVGADPRMQELASLFPNRETVMPLDSSEVPFLAEDLSAQLVPWRPNVVDSRCIDADLADIDPVADGVQPDCEVTERDRGAETLMPACDDGAGVPCWRVARDPQSCSTGQQLDLRVERGDLEPPDGGMVEAQCVAR